MQNSTQPVQPRDEQLAREWQAYDRELPRLIGDGYEGQFALFKGDELLGVYYTQGEALVIASHRFVEYPYLVAEIVWREPLIRPPDWVVENNRAINRPRPAHHPLLRPSSYTIHYTKIPKLQPEDVFYREQQTYLRELPRLLAEGQERKFCVIKGDDLIGIYDTDEEASAVRWQKYGAEPCMVQPILEYEPVLFSYTLLVPQCRSIISP